ncbi:class F sortase [Aeromicrobium sp.]
MAVSLAMVMLGVWFSLNPSETNASSTRTAIPIMTLATAAPAIHMPRSVPVRLRIPTIGVDSKLMDLGLKRDGSLEVPPQAKPAGWYSRSPTPGEIGPAVIAGHIAWNSDRGVFFDLTRLRPGSEVFVDRKDGSTAVFRVLSLKKMDKDLFPSDEVYSNIDHAGLRLITCADFNQASDKYEDNLVAFAELEADSAE